MQLTIRLVAFAFYIRLPQYFEKNKITLASFVDYCVTGDLES